VALVVARWHADIVDEFVSSFTSTWAELGGDPALLEVSEVPGALEIPLQAKQFVQTGDYAAVVGCAFVVDGGIYRHDFVAATVLEGMMRVQLDSGVPVLSGVLTPHQFQESEAHIRFFREHFVVKGREAAQSCAALLTERDRLGFAARVSG
jgi:6,7-dimethyl-8-ribityllumazine synthase